MGCSEFWCGLTNMGSNGFSLLSWNHWSGQFDKSFIEVWMKFVSTVMYCVSSVDCITRSFKLLESSDLEAFLEDIDSDYNLKKQTWFVLPNRKCLSTFHHIWWLAISGFTIRPRAELGLIKKSRPKFSFYWHCVPSWGSSLYGFLTHRNCSIRQEQAREKTLKSLLIKPLRPSLSSAASTFNAQTWWKFNT